MAVVRSGMDGNREEVVGVGVESETARGAKRAGKGLIDKPSGFKRRGGLALNRNGAAKCCFSRPTKACPRFAKIPRP